MEYAIITILAVITLWQTWRKRVWKRRALSNQLNLWHVFRQSFIDHWAKTEWRIVDGHGECVSTDKDTNAPWLAEWPEVVND